MNARSWTKGLGWVAVLLCGGLAISCSKQGAAQRTVNKPVTAQPLAVQASPGKADQENNVSAETDSAEDKQDKRVYRSPLAGAWYPADPKELKSQLKQFLEKADVQPVKRVCALLVPHAGYRWSGQTAAFAYKTVQGKQFKRVVVLGPSHRVPMENVVSVPDGFTHYATPLGEVPLDTAFIQRLLKYEPFEVVPYAHDGEHSVQIQLPWLQTVLGGCLKLVPIVVGQLDRNTMKLVGRVLSRTIGPETLVVVSSDFTHYGPNYNYVPFKDDVPANLKKLDMGAWQKIADKDFKGFCDYVERTKDTICGRNAIGVLLAMLPKDAQVRLLHYDTSGNISGDYTNSVSYLAAVFSARWPPAEKDKEGGQNAGKTRRLNLSEQEKQTLLQLARRTLQFVLEKKKIPTVKELGVELTPNMKRVAGAFVTLKKNGELRGCIGEIFPSRPLYKAVMAEAINAGLADPRFPPVTLSELKELTFEISVLFPPQRVKSWREIQIGRHGIVLRKNGRTAVFLPQVAVEQHWDLETTLSHLSRKAGLPPDAWREGAEFQVFEAIVFSEKE